MRFLPEGEMIPFFAIRIDYNPKDSIGGDYRDRNTFRREIAREYEPDDSDNDADECEEDNDEAIIFAITKCILSLCEAHVGYISEEFLRGIAWRLLVRNSLETSVIELAKMAADGCENGFLEDLQAVIDAEKAKGKP
jgi:hypothetical protein